MHIIYGGSFNPPTKAHEHVYAFLMKALNPRKFTFLPVSTAYHKSGLESNTHRFNMLRLMFAHNKQTVVSDYELKLETFEGTYASLQALKEADDTCFVFGADHLLGLHRWKHVNKLLHEFKLIVLNRGQTNINALIMQHPFLSYYQDRFIVFNAFESPYSSTQWRLEREDALLDERVKQYIHTHQLYQR